MMKSSFFLVCAIFCVGALLLAITTNSQHLGHQKAAARSADGELQKVVLQCTPGGAAAGTVRITNLSAETISANTIIYLANFGGNTSAQLSEPLSPGAAKQVPGPPGAFKTCQAWFYKQPVT
jgi:hypothetical protein